MAYQAKTGLDIPIHSLTAASCGFLAPFLLPDLLCDFRPLPRSVRSDAPGHKFGLAPRWGWLGSYGERLRICLADGLGGIISAATCVILRLNFSRPGGQVIVSIQLPALRMEGYEKFITGLLLKQPNILATEISKARPFEMIYGGAPDYGFQRCAWRMKPGLSLDSVCFSGPTALRVRGWQVPAYLLPPLRRSYRWKGFLASCGSAVTWAKPCLLDDIRQALNFIGRHPEQRPISARIEAGWLFIIDPNQ